MNLFMQVPLVGLFMGFVWFNGKEQRTHQTDRDEAFQKALRGVMSDYKESLGNVAGKFEKALERNTVQLNTLSAIVVHHDATVRGENDNTQGDTEEMKRILKQSLRGKISAES